MEVKLCGAKNATLFRLQCLVSFLCLFLNMFMFNSLLNNIKVKTDEITSNSVS